MKIIGLAAVTLVLAASLPAQEDERYRALAYGYFGGGSISSTAIGMMQTGLGAEARLYKGLGVGAEIGYLTPTRDTADGVGMFSANALYHFAGGVRSRKVDPFVSGGVSAAFRFGGGVQLWNAGGGVDYWFARRVGVRVEFRDYFRKTSWNDGQVWGIRGGVVFR